MTENPDLRGALSDPARSVEDKQALVRSLLDGKADAATTARSSRGRQRGTHGDRHRGDRRVRRAAAKCPQRLVAPVRVAQPAQRRAETRLAAALGRSTTRPVHLNMVVDPEVVGGIHVEIGDEVIDGTVSSRLDDAPRRLAG